MNTMNTLEGLDTWQDAVSFILTANTQNKHRRITYQN